MKDEGTNYQGLIENFTTLISQTVTNNNGGHQPRDRTSARNIADEF